MSADGVVQFILVLSDIKKQQFNSQEAIAGRILEPSIDDGCVFTIKPRKKASARDSSLFIDQSTGSFLVYPGEPNNGKVSISRTFFNHSSDIMESETIA